MRRFAGFDPFVIRRTEWNTDTMGVYGYYYLKRAIVTQVGLG